MFSFPLTLKYFFKMAEKAKMTIKRILDVLESLNQIEILVKLIKIKKDDFYQNITIP